MKTFAELFFELEDGPRPREQQRAIVRWLESAGPAEAAWGIFLLVRGKRPVLVKPKVLAEWAREFAGLTEDLFELCHEEAGDLVEAMSLVLPAPCDANDDPLDVWLARPPLDGPDLSEEALKEATAAAWKRMEFAERFILNRLLVGWPAPPVGRNVVVQAVASYAGLSPTTVEHRLASAWIPSPEGFRSLTAADSADADPSRPYPFRPAMPLAEPPQSLGDAAHWQAERRYDGLRVQLVRRAGATYLWSRAGDLVTERFPEVADLPFPEGTALDGEVVAWGVDGPLPAAALSRRLECKLLPPARSARKKGGTESLLPMPSENRRLPPKMIREVPVRLFAFDLLEHAGQDLRGEPLSQRRARLEALLHGAGPIAQAAAILAGEDWAELDRRRNLRPPHVGAGLVLKRRDGAYHLPGEAEGPAHAWRAWKPDPHRVEAVLTYVQQGTDGRASEFTFGLWRDGELVTFATAPNDLPESEAAELERIVRRTVREKFGPVTGLKAECVFEVSFEKVEPAPRRKSGAAVSGVRVVRWLKEKRADEAARLDAILALFAPTTPDRNG